MSGTTIIQRIAVGLAAGCLLVGCGGEDPDGDETVEAPGTLMQSDVERDTDPDVDDETFGELTGDNRDFAFSIFDQLIDEEGEDENVFVSPYSISSALVMTYGGADGETAEEMGDALRFELDDDQLHPAFNRLDLELDERSDVETDDDERLELEFVNQTWGHEDFPFRDAYLELLAANYGAGMYAVDFVRNYEEIRQDINAWVEERTEGHIDELLPDGSLDDMTRMVLVNAIYFYGSWDNTFDEDRTSEEPFETVDGSEVDVDMMQFPEPESVGYYDGEETTAVSLPYVGNELSMIVAKPDSADQGFVDWEQDFDRDDFDEVVDELETDEGEVELPKFGDEGDYDLVDAFEALGMERAFEPSEAEFGGMVQEGGGDPLFIDGIFHSTFIDVDEAGTEAAAATAVVMAQESAPISEFEVTFDRPFHYAIYDHETDTILFMGRMLDPS